MFEPWIYGAAVFGHRGVWWQGASDFIVLLAAGICWLGSRALAENAACAIARDTSCLYRLVYCGRGHEIVIVRRCVVFSATIRVVVSEFGTALDALRYVVIVYVATVLTSHSLSYCLCRGYLIWRCLLPIVFHQHIEKEKRGYPSLLPIPRIWPSHCLFPRISNAEAHACILHRCTNTPFDATCGR